MNSADIEIDDLKFIRRPANVEQPYPGLRSFARAEASLFFGRDRCVADMSEALERNRFLAVLGASGSGKSSLVRTGLFETLEAGRIRGAGSRWLIADMPHPQNRPFHELAIALLRALKGDDAPADADVGELRDRLMQGPRSLIEWCDDAGLPPDRNVLVLVDQFEELFRYADYKSRESLDAFVQLLTESAATFDRPIYIVITMRSEYLGACALVPGLTEAINSGLFLAPWMTRDECRLAIVGPSRILGFDIQSALVTRLLNDIATFAPISEESHVDHRELLARRSDQLPLLQHVLNRLWRQSGTVPETGRKLLDIDAYDGIGGLQNAIDQHAQSVLTALPPDLHRTVERVFRALIAGSSVATAVRRPLPFADLVEECGGDHDAVARVVEAFRARDCNFLTPPPPEPLGDDTGVDISHESLVRQWSSLRDWVAREAEAGVLWSALRAQALEMNPQGKRDLLGGRALERRLAWWSQEDPTEAWAKRYGGEHQAVRDLLTASAEAEMRETRRRRRRGMLIATTAIGGSAALVAGLLIAGGVIAASNARAEADRVGVLEEVVRLETAEQRLAEKTRQAEVELAAKERIYRDQALQAQLAAEAVVRAAQARETEAKRASLEAERRLASLDSGAARVAETAVGRAEQVFENTSGTGETAETAIRQELDTVELFASGREGSGLAVDRARLNLLLAEVASERMDPAALRMRAQRAQELVMPTDGRTPTPQAQAILAKAWLGLAAAYAMSRDQEAVADAVAQATPLAQDARSRAPEDGSVRQVALQVDLARAIRFLDQAQYTETLDVGEPCARTATNDRAETLIAVQCGAVVGLAKAHMGQPFEAEFQDAEARLAKMREPMQRLGYRRARMLMLLRRAEALAQVDPNDPKVRQYLAAIAGVYTGLDDELLQMLMQARSEGLERELDLQATAAERLGRSYAGDATGADAARTQFAFANRYRQRFASSAANAVSVENQLLLAHTISLLDAQLEFASPAVVLAGAAVGDLGAYRLGLEAATLKTQLDSKIADATQRRAALENTSRRVASLLRIADASRVEAWMATYPLVLTEPQALAKTAAGLCTALRGREPDLLVRCDALLAQLEGLAASPSSLRTSLSGQLEAAKRDRRSFAPLVSADRNGVALRGYDAVSYFVVPSAGARPGQSSVPARGRPEHAYVYRGAVWLFASPETLGRFKASPGRYAPEYGGFAADQVGEDDFERADANAFAVLEGKLYLFTSPKARDAWNASFSEEADRRWRAYTRISPLADD